MTWCDCRDVIRQSVQLVWGRGRSQECVCVCDVRLTNRCVRTLGFTQGAGSGSPGRLLTDSGDGRRALELQAWVQLACPLPGACPGAGGGAWPGAGTSAKEAAGPTPGPGAWFGPGQGWEPCGVWVRNNQEPKDGAKNCGRSKEKIREGSKERSEEQVDRGTWRR